MENRYFKTTRKGLVGNGKRYKSLPNGSSDS
jgi:hypothetical protein